MKKLTAEQFDMIRSWIYRNGRPIDLARYQYHFENGGKNNVIKALEVYQNQDGGFGHGIEPDFWNPNSSPTAVRVAFTILKEINCFDEYYPVIHNSLNYLDNCEYYGENGWRGMIPSNNDYLHSEWWHYKGETWDLCPTATLVGFILRSANKESSIYKKALELTEECISTLFNNLFNQAVSTSSYVFLLSDLRNTNIDNLFDLKRMEMCLYNPISIEIERDISKWRYYTERPSNYITSPDSPFYQTNIDIMEKELDYIINTINQDGSWDIYWKYPDNPDFYVCTNWWKSDIAIKRLLLLRAFDRLS